ncbi:hypothetical protein I203_105129 [Kwoniella mangroviensis CBS 8507]|uniref:uncharacterized protein n=1 Tax=Kwoniella mangroviensis CBS 8507 TaxID=1296122 RepID=UPI00080D13B7|nr:uncharacterized protein I203_00953 [Kwoniella mangroviensis CBS 8507]OCF69102.1 hypothetical protein I203_00953 [Kwoniella mangroviensis CBS 8507]
MLSTLNVLPTTLLMFLIATIHYLASHSHSTQSDPTEKIWNVERTGLMISLYTSTLNNLPQSLLNKLNIKLARRLKAIYNAGIGFGLLGMMIALGGSCWATMSVWKSVLEEVNLHTLEKVQQGSAGNIVKRAYTENGGADVVMEGSRDFAGGLQPLIPGLTMPWRHLPTLALALMVNQLIHEFGHAVSAALDDIQPSRFSFSLYAGIPSMMVSFPSNIDTLDPNAKMRLATSGPFHNLLTWFFIWLLTFGGVGKLFWYDRSNEGMVVKEVHWNSPLYSHLTPGSVLTHLDDVPLSATPSSPDPWSEYLSSDITDNVGDEGRGWCMDKTTFLSQPEPSQSSSEIGSGKMDCRDNSTSSERIAFQSTHGLTKGSYRCLNPLPILNIKSTKCPCPDSRWVCIRPDPSEEILRIGTKDGILLFTGPREEVLRDVRVRKEDARGWKGGVRWGELFFNYASTFSLSLFLFNLLPLPLTDGSQLLESLLEWKSVVGPITSTNPLKATIHNNLSGTTNNDGAGPSIKLYREYEMDSDDEEQYIGIGSELEPIDRPTRGRGKEVGWKRWIRRGIQWFSLFMVGLWGMGWAIVLLLRSS